MKRAIVYLVIGVLGLAGVPYAVKGLIGELPMGIVGMIFYGLVFYTGLMRLNYYRG